MNFPDKEGLPADIINEIIEDKQGNIWFATYGGLARLNLKQNRFTYFTVGEGLAFNLVNRVFEDSQGTIWAGTYNHGLSSLSIRQTAGGESYTFRNYTKNEGLPGNNVLSIAEHRDGTLWFGTDEGACQYTHGGNNQNAWFRTFTTHNGLTNNAVNTILMDKQGRILFGTEQGVTIYESVDAGSLVRFTQYTDREGLSNNDVRSILEDRKGNLWFGNYYGISRFSPAENRFTTFTEDDGFLGTGCLTNSICEDRSGKIWIGTYRKLTVFDPARVRPDTAIPNVQLTDIRLFNEKIAWQPDTSIVLRNGVRVGNFRFRQLSDWYGIPEELSLPYNHNFVNFDFVGINTNTPPTVRYQYQLAGLDETWSSPTNRSEATYGNLPPATTRFGCAPVMGEANGVRRFNTSFGYAPLVGNLVGLWLLYPIGCRLRVHPYSVSGTAGSGENPGPGVHLYPNLQRPSRRCGVYSVGFGHAVANDRPDRPGTSERTLD